VSREAYKAKLWDEILSSLSLDEDDAIETILLAVRDWREIAAAIHEDADHALAEEVKRIYDEGQPDEVKRLEDELASMANDLETCESEKTLVETELADVQAAQIGEDDLWRLADAIAEGRTLLALEQIEALGGPNARSCMRLAEDRKKASVQPEPVFSIFD